jgi:effector-binding domain-containing protein
MIEESRTQITPGLNDMRYPVTVVESTPHTVLELRRYVRADHAGDDIGAGMQTLYELAARIGLAPSGPPSTTYHGALGPGTSTEVHFGLPVDPEPLGGAAEITVRRTEPELFAHTTHHGDYHRIGEAYRALDDWLRSSTFQPVGPPTEVYLVAPNEAVQAHGLVIEIRIPVAAAQLVARVPAPFADTVSLVRRRWPSRASAS